MARIAYCALWPIVAAAQAPNWSGSIRCEIQIDAPGYHHQETQTWTLTGEPPVMSGAIPQYPATWSVKGEGRLDPVDGKSGQRARWTTGVGGMKARIAFFVRQSDDTLIVRTAHSSLRAPAAVKLSVQQIAAGKEQPARSITQDAFEWVLEPINDDPKRAQISGSLTVQPVTRWGPMQPPGAQLTARSTWQFSKGTGSQPVAGTAQLVSLQPSSVPQGLSGGPTIIELTGGSTQWVQGKTSVDFGPGILLYAPVNVISAEKAQAVIVVALNAALGPRPVTVTTGSEVATRSDALTIMARGSRNITEVIPKLELQGRTNLSVALTGEETAFAPGISKADFGAGVSVVSLTVNSPTSATAILNIDPQATAGPRSIKVTTGSEVATAESGFTIGVAPGIVVVPELIGLISIPTLPSITQISPPAGAQGANNLAIRLTGSSTRFAPGTTRADFGTGVTVASLAVHSPTAATAVLNISSTATQGARTVTLTTGSEMARLANGFTVTRAGPVSSQVELTPVGTASLKQVSPDSGPRRMANLNVDFTGSFTQFVAGTTSADFGPGITLVSPVNVTSASTASAMVNISADAVEGPRNVTVTTGSEKVTLANGFTVTASTSPLNAVNDSYSVAQNATLVSGSGMVAQFGTGGTGPSTVTEMTDVDGTLMFFGQSPGGIGLWKSDGTPAGTVLLKAVTSAKNLARVNRTLFFGNRGMSATEIWKSDGTPAGTVLVKAVRSDLYSSVPYELTDVNGTLFFVLDAYSPERNFVAQELWKSDGTAAGTVPLKAINPGRYDSSQFFLTNANGTLYFAAMGPPGTGNCLWKSDGTAAGTVMITPIALEPTNSCAGMRPFIAVNGVLFFIGRRPPVAGTTGFLADIWKSDGTAAGTVRVQDLSPNPPSNAIRVPLELANVNETLMFTMLDCTTVGTREIWRSDGTAAGTVALKTNLNSGDKTPNLMFPTNVNGRLFFRAKDGSGGYGLWKSEGTAAGTSLIKTVTLPTIPCNQLSFHPLVNANGTLFFANGSGLWRSDGTAEGTILVKAGMIENLTSVNGAVYYTMDSYTNTTSSRDLWISGTAANLLANDSLSQGVTTVLGTGPSNGTLALRTDGTFTYRPNASFTGTDRFTYTVRDGSRTSAPATVTISVTARTTQ